MKLRVNKASPFARKVRILAREAGLAGRVEEIETAVSPVAPNEDLARENPLIKIPALVTDNGELLYDSAVICEYLDTLHSGRKLFPGGRPAALLGAAPPGADGRAYSRPRSCAVTKWPCAPRRCAGRTGSRARSARFSVGWTSSRPRRRRGRATSTSATSAWRARSATWISVSRTGNGAPGTRASRRGTRRALRRPSVSQTAPS